MTDCWKVDLRKRLLNFGNMYKVLVFWQFRGPYLHENTVFAPNPSSTLKIKHWRFKNMWNLKIEFGTIFWDILTLHLSNTKSSILTTGTFWYVTYFKASNQYIVTFPHYTVTLLFFVSYLTLSLFLHILFPFFSTFYYLPFRTSVPFHKALYTLTQ